MKMVVVGGSGSSSSSSDNIMKTKISPADISTCANGLLGSLAIVTLFLYYPDITYATGLIFLALMFDGLDGVLARKFGSNHAYGQYLDSIADSISFCIAPAFIVAVQYYPRNYLLKSIYWVSPFVIFTTILIVVCGIYRLTQYSRSGYKLSYFCGLPTPAMALFVLMVSHVLYPHSTVAVATALILLCGTALLMMPNNSKLIYPKLRGKFALAFILVLLLSTLSIATLKFSTTSLTTIYFYYQVLAVGGLVALATYIFISPIYAKVKKIVSS